MALSGNVLTLSPQASTAPGETHAAYVLSQQTVGPAFTFTGEFELDAQLRTGSAPNAWESPWVTWGDHVDAAGNHLFYYAAFKTNGWEIGKIDFNYPGGQRFLASGSDHAIAAGANGAAHSFEITQTAAGTFTVKLDGATLASFTDTDNPYGAGNLGFYTEDAKVTFDNIGGTIADNFDGNAPGNYADGAAIGQNWAVAFNGFGTVNVGRDEGDASPPAGATLVGTSSADNLVGGSGHDNISGKGGKDNITGGQGNDTLSGNGGADTFIYSAGFGHDVIADFLPGGTGHDFVRLLGITGVNSFADVLANTQDVNGHAVFTAPGTADTIDFTGVVKSQFIAGDFLFA
jgi:Ca2+-binding RTX toxin-like protein